MYVLQTHCIQITDPLQTCTNKYIAIIQIIIINCMSITNQLRNNYMHRHITNKIQQYAHLLHTNYKPITCQLYANYKPNAYVHATNPLHTHYSIYWIHPYVNRRRILLCMKTRLIALRRCVLLLCKKTRLIALRRRALRRRVLLCMKTCLSMYEDASYCLKKTCLVM